MEIIDILNLEKLKIIESQSVNGDFIKVYDFYYTNLEFDVKNNALRIICQWNRK